MMKYQFFLKKKIEWNKALNFFNTVASVTHGMQILPATNLTCLDVHLIDHDKQIDE